MAEFYKWLDDNIWACKTSKCCVGTLDAVSGLMAKFGVHEELAEEIVQGWVYSKNWN